MEIKGFIDISLVDWDGKISSVIFLPSCNMRCPFCYNATLVLYPEKMQIIPFEQIAEYLKRNRGWIDGVVISGGEPMTHKDLPELCLKIKKLGLLVKVDTNGTNPTMTKQLINDGLVDYMAMDVKAPLIGGKYSMASGVDAGNLLEKIRETINILMNSKIEYEFRTTLVPTLHKKEDVKTICEEIRGCKKYALQNFKGNVETINPEFKNLKPLPEKRIKMFLKVAKEIIPNTILRG